MSEAQRTLVVTNDFPPRTGGIQTYVHALASRQPPGSIVVYAPSWSGAEKFDSELPFPVVRHPTSLMLPIPDVARRAQEIARAEQCTTVWFGAAAPLALLTPGLRRAGIGRAVGSTHGHETGWAALPGARQLLRRVGRQVDVVTYITDFTRSKLAGALGRDARLEHLPPGVDVAVFRPDVDRESVRRLHGLAGRRVIVCVSRLVPRKGQDVLIAALPRIRAAVPDAALLLVGHGPDISRLRRLADRLGVTEHVAFAGEAPLADLPMHYAAGDVFAMPCRTRRGGLDVEGLGMVYLEASAVGLPVVAGNSGGAPEAVRHGETGYVVDDPRSPDAVARPIVRLLRDDGLRARMGAAGRAWVEAEWSWDLLATRLGALLTPASPGR